MGYDIDITRAPWLFRAHHFPIRTEEWHELVAARPHLRLEVAPSSTRGYLGWGDNEGFFWGDGHARAKHPSDATLAGMIEIAAALDAWVIGEEGERYFPGPVSRHDVPTMVMRGIDRSHGGRSVPITEDEWTALVAAQPDFVLLDEISADLPSGRRTIPAPPTPHWTEGRVPFLWQSDGVVFEVEHYPDPEWPTVPTPAGEAVLARARLLADALDATVEY